MIEIGKAIYGNVVNRQLRLRRSDPLIVLLLVIVPIPSLEFGAARRVAGHGAAFKR